MKDQYNSIIGRINREMNELEQLVERINIIWEKVKISDDDYYVDATALNLHSLYTGLERIFEIIADGIDSHKPTGSNWHQELLRQMSSGVPGVRPHVLSIETQNTLDRFRGFRHVVRNVYSYNFDIEQIALLVKQLKPTVDQVKKDLGCFIDFLNDITKE